MSKFKKLESELKAKGVENPGGLAYHIGVKKHGGGAKGKKAMASLAAQGRRKAAKKLKDSYT